MKILKQLLKTALILCVLASLAFVTPQYQAVQAQNGAGNTVVYNLFATDAFVNLADGAQVYNYGFVGGREGVPLTYQLSQAEGGGIETLAGGSPHPSPGPVTGAEEDLQGNAQFPGPLIYATTADVVQINFKNLGVTNPGSPNDPHSIHLHGLDVNAANDGVPETSVGAVPANEPGLKGAGNVIVYMFSPKNPGTYMYHCHQEADIHVQMGMYGALVIYNPTDAAAKAGPGTGKGGTLWGWKYDKDYVLLMSEIDTRQHDSEQTAGDFNPVDFNPQYWLINGLSFPNTIHVDGGSGFVWDDWIAAHPGYDPFIVGSVGAKKVGTGLPKGQKVLLRMINMGFQTQPMHMHGFHAKVLGSDQRPFTWTFLPSVNFGTDKGMFGAFGAPTGMEKQTLTIGSGETYEWLIDFGQQSMAVATYPPGTQTRYNPDNGDMPVSNTQTDKPAIPLGGDPDADITYIGGPQVTGAVIAQTPGQLFPFHNHDDYKATNNGVYPGGMFTMIMTVP